MSDTPPPVSPRAGRIGLLAGIAILLAVLLLPPPPGLSAPGWHTLGLVVLMVLWWTTEPVPIAVTALLPIILLPLMGVLTLDQAAAPYANPLVFLFLGGFLLAAGLQRWGLHRQIAFAMLRWLGGSPRRLVLGFMLASAFMSIWISNTATVLLLLPVAAGISRDIGADIVNRRNFAAALMLGVAYGASIGGVGTLIGSPPNALVAGYLSSRQGIDISFLAWSAATLPFVALFLPLAWLVLTRLTHPLPMGRMASPRAATRLPPLSAAERRVAAVFALAAALWIARPALNALPGLTVLSDSAIALACAALLFVIPSNSPEGGALLRWADTRDLPWNVLLLFGGGLALAAATDVTGLAGWIGGWLGGLGHMHRVPYLLVLVATFVFLTEMTSNTALVAALLPVAAEVARTSGMDIAVLGVALAMAASCAFMLPMATPPNALVFASGHVRITDMLRAGLVLNMISIVLVSLACWTYLPRVLP